MDFIRFARLALHVETHEELRNEMKTPFHIACALILSMTWSCGGGGSEVKVPPDVPYQILEVPPEAPEGLQVFGATAGEMELGWTDATEIEESYVVERSKDHGGFTTVATIDRNSTVFRDSGAPADSTYEYRVRAQNRYGLSEPSNIVTVPKAPVSLSIQPDFIFRQVHIRFIDQADNESAFELQRKNDTSDWTALSTDISPDSSYHADSVDPGAGQYSYRLRACTTANALRGCSAFAGAVSLSQIPGTPTLSSGGYYPTPVRRVILSFTYSGTMGVTSFDLYRKVDMGLWQKITSVAPKDPVNNSYTATDPLSGGVFGNAVYKITSRVVDVGESDYSNEIPVTVAAP